MTLEERAEKIIELIAAVKSYEDQVSLHNLVTAGICLHCFGAQPENGWCVCWNDE